jgi:2-oxoglutarate ferredoxin oxidoreductase subunit gamma
MGQFEVTFAGFGGQGVMVAGQLLAYTGIKEGKQVVWIPSYGPEMRGGTAYCTVVVSDARIGSPIIRRPKAACVFNRPSFDKFSPMIKPGNQMAIDAGNVKVANIVMLGAFVGASGVASYNNLETTLREKLGRKKGLLDINLKVLRQGYDLAMKALKKKERA